MSSRSTKGTTALAVALAFLTVCVAGPGLAAAAPAAADSATSEWAYGALRTTTFQGSAGIYEYDGSATYGLAVVFNETTSSASVHTIHVNRTMGAILAVSFCTPNCHDPTAKASVSFHAWETVDAWANLTSSGTVYAPNATSALALLNSSVRVGAHLRESGSYVRNGTLILSKSLSVDVGAADAVTMTPALGLVPVNLTPHETWNSSSLFSAHGALQWSLVYVLGGLLFPHGQTVHLRGNSTLNASGTVTVAGAYQGSTVMLDGSAYPAVNLTLTGPFVLREGLLLVPTGTDLFGAASHPWTTNESAFATTSQANVDVGTHLLGGSHLALAGSGSWWHARSANLALLATAGMGPALAGTDPAASPQNATYVQTSPESVGQARSDGACLTSGVGCASTGSGITLGPWLAAGLAVLAASVIAVALIAERRRSLPPTYPNSALYPPGGAGPVNLRAGLRPAPPPSTPSDDDPLGHLW